MADFPPTQASDQSASPWTPVPTESSLTFAAAGVCFLMLLSVDIVVRSRCGFVLSAVTSLISALQADQTHRCAALPDIAVRTLPTCFSTPGHARLVSCVRSDHPMEEKT